MKPSEMVAQAMEQCCEMIRGCYQPEAGAVVTMIVRVPDDPDCDIMVTPEPPDLAELAALVARRSIPDCRKGHVYPERCTNPACTAKRRLAKAAEADR